MSLPTMDEALDELGIRLPSSRKIECPKHTRRSGRSTPSLHVYEDHFYCYGCGKHGDGIGLIALFTGQDVRNLLRERGGRRDPAKSRLQTKGLKPRDVSVAAYRKYSALHAWFFKELADAYGDSAVWAYMRAIDLWSEVFDDFRDWVLAKGVYLGDAIPTAFEQEKRLRLMEQELRDGLVFERKDGARLKYRSEE